MKKTVGANIRARRKALDMTILELANRTDYDVGNLSRLERGQQGYSPEVLEKFAGALGCSVADLFKDVDGSNVDPVPLGMRRVPLISYIQAGAMTEAVEPYQVGAAQEWLLTDLELSKDAFALEIKGLSMYNPADKDSFEEGDRVIIEPSVAPGPGDFVAAINGGHEATFKKYRPRGMNERGDMVFELVPLNPDYESLRSDITPIRIIGTMIERRRYRKKR